MALRVRMAIPVLPAKMVTQVARAQLVRLAPLVNQATTVLPVRTAIQVVLGQ